MKKIIRFILIGLVLSLSNLAYGAYTETLIGNQLIGGGNEMGWHGDDSSWSYNLPFPFPFYGTSYNSVYICSNGFINFTSSTRDYSNTTNELKSRVQIAPLWDDLRTDVGDRDIYIRQPTSDSLCIRWYAVQYSNEEPVEFEVVLYRNGDIKFNYGETSSSLSPTVGISKGDNATFLLSTYDGRSSLNYAGTSYIREQVPTQPPVANFTADRTSGVAPLTVQFTSTSTGTITSYSWTFGDGGTSSSQNPSHQYSAGTYTVKLTVTGPGGSDTEEKPNYITVTAPPPPVSIPRLIRFQGKLKDSGGPLEGPFDVTFRLYTADTGGTPIWQEVQRDVNIEDGMLDVELGSVTALNLAFDRQYWLGVEIEADGEMIPRFKLTTVPYSFRSAQ